jgi:hypothetical protein
MTIRSVNAPAARSAIIRIAGRSTTIRTRNAPAAAFSFAASASAPARGSGTASAASVAPVLKARAASIRTAGRSSLSAHPALSASPRAVARSSEPVPAVLSENPRTAARSRGPARLVLSDAPRAVVNSSCRRPLFGSSKVNDGRADGHLGGDVTKPATASTHAWNKTERGLSRPLSSLASLLIRRHGLGTHLRVCWLFALPCPEARWRRVPA